MAPVKQSLLSLHTFMKNPKLSMVKKHQKLEKIAAGLPVKYRTKPKVDKKREERLKQEKVISEGAEEWRCYLAASGHADANTFRTDVMFEAYGRPSKYTSRIGGKENTLDEENSNCGNDTP
jgi:hypothetical protein